MLTVLVIVLGTVGFGATIAYDLLQLKHTKRFLPLVAIIGAIGVAFSTFALYLLVPVPNQPTIFSVACIVLAIVSFLLLVWSVVFEIPFLLRRGSSGAPPEGAEPGRRVPDLAESRPRRVLDRGTYSLTRHPGLLWYFSLVLFSALLFRHPIVIALGAYLFALDLVVVLVEDFVIFPKLFVDYERYKTEVPMLIPRFTGRRRSGES